MKRCIDILKKLGSMSVRVSLLLAILVIMVIATDIANSAPPTQSPNPLDVNVVNTANVNVTNTPTVNLAPGSSIGIIGTSDVVVGNTGANPVPVGITGTPNVNIVNTATNPVNIRDVDKRQPFQAVAQVFLNFPDTQGVAKFNPDVPAGKLFVIELVSAHTMVPKDQKMYYILFVNTDRTMVQYYFAPTLVGTDFTIDHYVMSQPAKLYAKSSNGLNYVNLTVTRFPSNAGSASATLALSGYLVDE